MFKSSLWIQSYSFSNKAKSEYAPKTQSKFLRFTLRRFWFLLLIVQSSCLLCKKLSFRDSTIQSKHWSSFAYVKNCLFIYFDFSKSKVVGETVIILSTEISIKILQKFWQVILFLSNKSIGSCKGQQILLSYS